MVDEKLTMVKTGQGGGVERYRLVPSGIASSRAVDTIATEYGGDTSAILEEGGSGVIQATPIRVGGRDYQYVPFGADDLLPYKIREKLLGNMITSQ